MKADKVPPSPPSLPPPSFDPGNFGHLLPRMTRSIDPTSPSSFPPSVRVRASSLGSKNRWSAAAIWASGGEGIVFAGARFS